MTPIYNWCGKEFRRLVSRKPECNGTHKWVIINKNCTVIGAGFMCCAMFGHLLSVCSGDDGGDLICILKLFMRNVVEPDFLPEFFFLL